MSVATLTKEPAKGSILGGLLFAFNRTSGNTKVGPIPVTTSQRATCPASCPLKGTDCYAENFRLKAYWDNVDDGSAKNLVTWEELCSLVHKLPKGQPWRHNQAGDLPSLDGVINLEALQMLVKANRGKRGWTYTHHSLGLEANREALREANKGGFTINLSANSLEEADLYKVLDVGPVVVTVAQETPKVSFTPQGHKVLVCPAQHTLEDRASAVTTDLTCQDCLLCQKASRSFIIGFRPEGANYQKKRLSLRLSVK